MLKQIPISSSSRNEMLDITAEVQDVINESGVQDGLCVIYSPHTTSGITINEGADPDVKTDMLRFLQEKIPKDYGFAHMEGNSDSHIKSSLVGISETVIVDSGKLILGTWQKIFFCEFDGPRSRTVFLKIVED